MGRLQCPPLASSTEVRGSGYYQKEEHRGTHCQIERIGGRAEPGGSAESQSENYGFEPWGSLYFPHRSWAQDHVTSTMWTLWVAEGMYLCSSCFHHLTITKQSLVVCQVALVCQIAPGPSCILWSEIVCLHVESWRFKLMVRESGSLIAVLSFFHLNQRKRLAYTTWFTKKVENWYATCIATF